MITGPQEAGKTTVAVMNRFGGFVLAMSVVLSGCSLASLVPGPVDPACQAHADLADCQAALEAAMEGLPVNLDSYVVRVAPISCADGQCATTVSALPNADVDCVPSYETELARDALGSWTVVMSSHGDPPCAFEQ